MQIVDFERGHMEQSRRLAMQNYQEERQIVDILPQLGELAAREGLPGEKGTPGEKGLPGEKGTPDRGSFPELDDFADNGLGVTALEGGEVVGFLCCYRPWNNAFCTDAVGTFSPIHAHGAVRENRAQIYKRMYQAAAEKWVRAGIASHSMALYAHDQEALRAFFTYGFGLRCVDAIRPMTEIEAVTCDGYLFREMGESDAGAIASLRRSLSDHLAKSPCFMKKGQSEVESWMDRAAGRDSRIFVAETAGKPIGFLETMDAGENFATEVANMKNICGAYCLSDHRGSGVMQNLLNFLIRTLKEEGNTRLGVDFESFNPTAYGFWLKYFTAYTHGVVRRIDENAVNDGGKTLAP